MRGAARLIAIGQRQAGDDGAALAVIDHLTAAGLPAGMQAHAIEDAADLIPLLQIHADGPVVVLDVLVEDGEPATLVEIPAASLQRGGRPLSSHGLAVGQAIALAGILAPRTSRLDLRVLGIRARGPFERGTSLSPEMVRAIPLLAQRILECLGAI